MHVFHLDGWLLRVMCSSRRLHCASEHFLHDSLCSSSSSREGYAVSSRLPAHALSFSRNRAAPSWRSTSPACPSWCSSTCWSSGSASGLPSSPKRKPRRARGIKRRWRCWATGASTWLSASSPWQASKCGKGTGDNMESSFSLIVFWRDPLRVRPLSRKICSDFSGLCVRTRNLIM